jgi:hypothetical protein
MSRLSACGGVGGSNVTMKFMQLVIVKVADTGARDNANARAAPRPP